MAEPEPTSVMVSPWSDARMYGFPAGGRGEAWLGRRRVVDGMVRLVSFEGRLSRVSERFSFTMGDIVS
jgi:hypothetical protein